MSSIIHVPNDILTSLTRTVIHFDKKLEHLVSEMKKILLVAQKPKGVGLSANQIGEPYSVFITKPTTNSEICTFTNPKIIKQVDESPKKDEEIKDDGKLEGCLSIPDIWGHVHRAKEITLQYQDINGKKYEETITGFLAQIVQHETDHINGILFSERVVEQKGKFFHSATINGKNVLKEIVL